MVKSKSKKSKAKSMSAEKRKGYNKSYYERNKDRLRKERRERYIKNRDKESVANKARRLRKKEEGKSR